MNVSKKLSPQDLDLLMAIISGGAIPHQPYKTTAAVLAQKLGMKEGENSETLLTESLRRLVMAEYSIEAGGKKAKGRLLSEVEIFDDGRLKLILNVPAHIAGTL
jgi:hypothetical protein